MIQRKYTICFDVVIDVKATTEEEAIKKAMKKYPSLELTNPIVADLEEGELR